MKRLVLAGISALAVVTTMAAANAADMARRTAMPVKAPLYAAPYNWTGFYVGINGGGGFGRSNWDNVFGSDEFKLSGGVAGGTLGYNWQAGQAVFGLEGDLDWSNIHGSSNLATCLGTSCDTSNSWLGTVRGRLGYAAGRFMPYITGGAAFGDIKTSVAGFGDASDTRVGWTLGGGIEAAIAGPWTAKLEYLYVDLGKQSCPAASCGVATDVNFNTSLVRAGVNYRF